MHIAQFYLEAILTTYTDISLYLLIHCELVPDVFVSIDCYMVHNHQDTDLQIDFGQQRLSLSHGDQCKHFSLHHNSDNEV